MHDLLLHRPSDSVVAVVTLSGCESAKSLSERRREGASQLEPRSHLGRGPTLDLDTGAR